MSEPRRPVDLALERLLAIEWYPEDHSWKESHMVLMWESVRRMALWRKVLYGETRLPAFPFRDITSKFDVPVQLDEATSQAFESLLEKQSRLGRSRLYTHGICMAFLRWVTIQDLPQVTRYALPNPYEPLIRIYERGESFFRGKVGEIEFVTVPACILVPRDKRGFISLCKRPPLLDLDDQTLDRLDSDAKRRWNPPSG